MTLLAGLLRTVRPRQWTKNLLVLAAPFAAGGVPGSWWPLLGCFVAFCLASGAVYAFNDVADVQADRAHPTKRHRPVASGQVSRPAAMLLGVVCGVAGLCVATWVGHDLGLLLAVYLGLQGAYVAWLKHEPVLDIAIVAAGFLLRAIAGGVATGLELSQWFLLVASFGALFMVAGKRYSELVVLGSQAGTRASLTRYSASYLRFVWGMAATVTVLTYSLWAFEVGPHLGMPWHVVSIAPFVLGIMRYAVDVDSGRAAAPEEVLWGDRALHVIGLCWLVLLGAGTYGG